MTELELLKAQQHAELDDLRKKHKDARRELRKKLKKEKSQAKRKKTPQQEQKNATRLAFYAAIACAYQTDDKKRLRHLAQLFRRRYGVNTAEGVADVLQKRKEREAARVARRQQNEEKKQLKKEFLAAVASCHSYSSKKCVHTASAWLRKKYGCTTAADVISYLAAREEKRSKIAELKQAREERKKAKAAEQEAEKKRVKELLQNGFLPLKKAAEFFNKIRHEHGQPSRSAKGLWSHFFRHNVKTVFFKGSEYWYSSIDVKKLALKNSKKDRSQYLLSQALFPVASAAELDSGEWVSIKEFAALADLPEKLIRGHLKNYDFKMLTHPDSGVMLLHTATAAAHFLNFYQK